MTLTPISKTGPIAVPGWKATGGVVLLCFAVVLAFQWLTGAYQAEFGSEPDEAAHYVTGLMVHDYMAAGFPGNPLHYARDYYQHYPKVALGHWPPFFYILQSVWTLVFTPDRASVLVLMALLTAAVATLVFSFLRPEVGGLTAMVGAMLFLAFPLVQRFAGAVMTEIPVALLVLLATGCFGRFLERERTADALRFGLLASLAILTKFSGFVLALVPPVAVGLTRKPYLLKRAAFWWPAGIVVGLCGPWTLLTLKLASEGMTEENWGWQFMHLALPYYATKFLGAVGAGVLLFAVIGLWSKVFPRGGRDRPTGRWAALAVLGAGVPVIHMIVPAGFEARHLVAALAPASIFAVIGAERVAVWLASRGVPAAAARFLSLGVLVGAFGIETFHLSPKGYAGFGPVAEALLKAGDAGPGRVLVSSDARGEGMFISELAMRENRPSHQILRGSKELASSSWTGSGYKSRFADEASLLAFLRTNSVRYVVADTSIPPAMRKDYHDQLQRAIEGASGTYILESCFSAERAGRWQTNAILLFRFATNQPPPAGAHLFTVPGAR